MSVLTVQREVEKLKERFIPKPKKEVWVHCQFAWNKDEPHGKYGGQLLEIYTGQYKAPSEREELEMLRESYADIPVAVRERAPYWSTWENFLEHNQCKCGKH
jgi:hypothetical protein